MKNYFVTIETYIWTDKGGLNNEWNKKNGNYTENTFF